MTRYTCISMGCRHKKKKSWFHSFELYNSWGNRWGSCDLASLYHTKRYLAYSLSNLYRIFRLQLSFDWSPLIPALPRHKPPLGHCKIGLFYAVILLSIRWRGYICRVSRCMGALASMYCRQKRARDTPCLQDNDRLLLCREVKDMINKCKIWISWTLICFLKIQSCPLIWKGPRHDLSSVDTATTNLLRRSDLHSEPACWTRLGER